MSKQCSYCKQSIPLKDFPEHLKTHGIEIMQDATSYLTSMKDLVESEFDKSNATINNYGLLLYKLLRWHPELLQNTKLEYDPETKIVKIESDFDEFIHWFVPFADTAMRVSRQLIKEAKEHPELHPNWIISDKVRTRRSYKALAYKNYYASQKEGKE